MQLHRSNRTEALVERLVEIVRRPVGGPLEAECIVVQGRGMERWLAMELARRLGSWANPWFPFPRRVLELAFAASDSRARPSTSDAFELERLTLVVASVLAEDADRPGLEPISRYLGRGERSSRVLDLAARIAESFDRAMVYRPDTVLAWDAGREDGWEAIVWRAVTARIGREHPPARARRFLAAAARGRVPLEGFPRRVSLFGISTLPPLYVELFAALARSVEVHLFMPSPSREFWAHVRSRRERLREARRAGVSLEDAALLHLEGGHPLLAENGRLARDFQAIVEQRVDYEEEAGELYVDPGCGTALSTLQSDVLALRHRRPGAGFEPPRALGADDHSIEVHACHSPMREVEVLRDRLLACFAEDPTLEPRDVVVMTPSIEKYAPFVEAALGGGTAGEPRIPFRVTDRVVRETDGAVAAFFRLLEVLERRFSAPEVVDLLELAAIRDRFDVDESEIDTIRRWVSRSGIRWGIDAVHRAETGQPARPENTWRFGLERLFVGYAMPGEDEGRLFADRLPYDGIEGTESDLLGRLADLVETLARSRRAFAAERTLGEWSTALLELVADTIHASGGAADELVGLRAAIRTLGTAADESGFTLPVGARAVRERLAAVLDADRPSTGFLAGGVTVCAMMPMRSIPFRVVCLLGLGDRDFPRPSRLPAFDRMARETRLGDRSPRDDDRFLFLEALLAARSRLLVTYVGRSVHDDAEQPPSVALSELLDVLDESFTATEGRARDRILVPHPLQAFSARYFAPRAEGADARLFSYSRLALSGARALRAGVREEAPPFVVGPLVRAGDDLEAVTLAALLRFFKRAPGTLVRRRLGIDLGDDSPRLAERESFDLGGLEGWTVGDRIVGHLIDGRGERRIREIVRASGDLPPGVLGENALEEAFAAAKAIVVAARARRDGDRLAPWRVEGEVGSVRLEGRLADLWPSGQVIATYSKRSAAQLIDAWIRHLFLCWGGPEGVEAATHLVTRKGTSAETVSFRAVEKPEELLAALLDLQRAGTIGRLPFFAAASAAYWDARSENDDERARRIALDVLVGRNARPDPYLELLYPDVASVVRLSPEFAAAARAVFAPLTGHAVEG